MSTVRLDTEEWAKVMAIIATASWTVANPLLMKIGDQLQRQQSTNSKEVPVPQSQLESDKATH
jgi:hypothetical protein